MVALSKFTLWRYIFTRFGGAVLAVFAGSFILLFLISLINTLARAGAKGDADTLAVLSVAFYGTPFMTEQMLPFSVLVASIGSFLNLSRRQELVVARSIGLSVWQLLLPALAVVLLIGAGAVTLYNPAAALLMEERARLQTKYFGDDDSLMSKTSSGMWLRQDGVDGQSVLRAQASSEQGSQLSNVTFIVFDEQGNFAERIEAKEARLGYTSWDLTGAWVVSGDAEPQFYTSYVVSTYLTAAQVQQNLGNPETVSFWNLPGFISAAERAGVPATSYKLRYQALLSLPFLLCAMVLISATVSLKVFRFGRIGMMVLIGMGAGLTLFMANEIMRDIGAAGILPPAVAVWLPVLMTALATTTVLLYQEDG